MPCTFLIKTKEDKEFKLIVFDNCTTAKPEDVVIQNYISSKIDEMQVIYTCGVCFVCDWYKVIENPKEGLFINRYNVVLEKREYVVNPRAEESFKHV